MEGMREQILTIIIPVYNSKRFLKECLESVLNQTFQFFELILVNDGSTDGSGEMCDYYANKDGRIRVIHQQNRGTVVARKIALSSAKGTYVGFVDADDTIEPEMFHYLINKIENTQSDFVQIAQCDDASIMCDKEDIIDVGENYCEVIKDHLFERTDISSNLWSKLFRTQKLRSAFKRIPEEQCYGEDLLCILHYLRICDRFCLCDHPLYHYRMVEASVSHKNWEQMCIESSSLYLEIKKILEEYGEWEVCRDSVASYYRVLLFEYLSSGFQKDNVVERYRFPNIADLVEKKVILYGAGKVGTDYYKQIVGNEKQQIVAWIDRNPVGSAVKSPDCLKRLEYDSILLAVAKEEVANEIREYLLNGGICDNPSKILWKKPERLW